MPSARIHRLAALAVLAAFAQAYTPSMSMCRVGSLSRRGAAQRLASSAAAALAVGTALPHAARAEKTPQGVEYTRVAEPGVEVTTASGLKVRGLLGTRAIVRRQRR